jgi:hypothetical protein
MAVYDLGPSRTVHVPTFFSLLPLTCPTRVGSFSTGISTKMQVAKCSEGGYLGMVAKWGLEVHELWPDPRADLPHTTLLLPGMKVEHRKGLFGSAKMVIGKETEAIFW